MSEKKKKPPASVKQRRHQVKITIPAMSAARRTAGRIDPAKGTKQKLVGYYSAGQKPNYTRQAEVNSWKDHVKATVGELTLPSATRERPVRVDVWTYYPDWTGSDPENVRKLIVDILFPSKHSKHNAGGEGDKYVFGFHDAYAVDKQRPRIEVTIVWHEEEESQ